LSSLQERHCWLVDKSVVRHAVMDHMKLSHISYIALVGGFSPWVWDQIVAAMGPGNRRVGTLPASLLQRDRLLSQRGIMRLGSLTLLEHRV